MSKFKIYWSTFFKEGVPNIEDGWGCYFISGFQGSGKSYFATFLTTKLDPSYKIYTNIKSLVIPKRDINYFTKIEDITTNTEENCIFVVDEISVRYPKESKTDREFYLWLQQSRKRGRIVILITQEWKEVPMWLRRPVRFLFTTRKLPLFPIFITTMGDGINTTFNKDTMEWECPTLCSFIYKRNKYITNMYDTFEPIMEL